MMSEFDINKHEWSDGDVELENATELLIFINVNFVYERSNEILKALGYLKKQDAIAIAKHFGLTAGWIAVSESLPDADGSYLVYQSGGYRFSRDFIDGEWVNAKSKKYGDITHWMPLPQPPQSKE